MNKPQETSRKNSNKTERPVTCLHQLWPLVIRTLTLFGISLQKRPKKALLDPCTQSAPAQSCLPKPDKSNKVVDYQNRSRQTAQHVGQMMQPLVTVPNHRSCRTAYVLSFDTGNAAALKSRNFNKSTRLFSLAPQRSKMLQSRNEKQTPRKTESLLT